MFHLILVEFDTVDRICPHYLRQPLGQFQKLAAFFSSAKPQLQLINLAATLSPVPWETFWGMAMRQSVIQLPNVRGPVLSLFLLLLPPSHQSTEDQFAPSSCGSSTLPMADTHRYLVSPVGNFRHQSYTSTRGKGEISLVRTAITLWHNSSVL